MKISIIQPDTTWENREKNQIALYHLIKPLFHSTDLVVLPEMFTTGFSMNVKTLAEKQFSHTYEWMLKLAEEGDLGICGSYIVKDRAKYCNRWIFVSKDKTVSYDKRHLFSMGNEESFFRAGKKRTVFEFRGFRIMPSICYDLRFPVWLRNQGDYDLLINSANWPEARKDVWNTLLKARAIENQCYVAGSNRIGTDGNVIKYSGESMIIGPKGEIISRADDDKECTITADISIKELNLFREKFPVLKDADRFRIAP